MRYISLDELSEANMDDIDARIRRAIEQSAAAEVAWLLERLRSMGAADLVADGGKGRLDAGQIARFLDAPRESHKLQSEAASQPDGVPPRKP